MNITFQIGMILVIISFIFLGFVALFFGAKLIVISLENIAKRLNLSHLLVGLTILAIGTSLPEIAVSVIGGFDKLYGIDPDIDSIVIGNKIGSFLIQITLILGILGVSQKIFVSKWVLRREGVMLFLSLFIFFLCAIDGIISRIDAIIMIISYLLYLFLVIKSERKIEKCKVEAQITEKKRLDPHSFETVDGRSETPSLKKNIALFILGLIILLIGAEITILSAHMLAIELNIPANVIGILVVGVGTSLPELMADLTALRRRSEGIAVGDILGSNICDILFATGSGALIADFRVDPIFIMFDIPMLFIAISIAFFFLWTEKTLKKWEAVFLIGFFGFYVLLKLLFFQI